VCAHRFVSVAEPDFGVAVLNTGRFGHGVFDGAIRVSLARAAQYPDPRADRGHHEVTLAVRPHGPGLADVRAAAARLNAPVRVVGGATGSRPSAAVTVTGEDGGPALGVGVDAVKLADDGSGDLIVRLHEACGNRSRVSVATADRIAAAWRCNLLEEPQTGEEVGDGIVALTLRPFHLVTLRLRRAVGDDGRSLRD
jgi:alpha-mannosidase